MTIKISDIDWLRNDYHCDITIGTIAYPSVEHAYQAAKVVDQGIKREIADASTVREARKLGKRATLVPNWDVQREVVMERLLRIKFSFSDYVDHSLADKLMDTGTEDIVMEGYDTFWGVTDTGDGDNVMGKLLMKIRADLQFTNGWTPEENEEDEEEELPPTVAEALATWKNIDEDVLEDKYDPLISSLDKLHVATVEVFKQYDELKVVFGMPDDPNAIVNRIGEQHRERVTKYYEALQACRDSIKVIGDVLTSKQDDRSAADVVRDAIKANITDDDEDDDSPDSY